MGFVGCCSGCLAAYRRDLMDAIIDDFVNQTFMGEKCTYSEDRHLTNLVLKNGYKVVFQPEAISYTNTPHTLRGFLRQQLRWRRGYIRESTYTLTFAWRTQPILFLELIFWDLTVPFASFAFMLTGLISIVSNPLFFVQYMVPSWIAYSLLRNFPLVVRAKDKIPGLLIFIGFYEFILYWQYIYALFTLKNKSWITRG
jgi:cellulose synthase/poly-beta-1,6-N-acetylglucosamine synthase-like glycosyltransferase